MTVYEMSNDELKAKFKKEHRSWIHMGSRCYDRNNPKYQTWGGRGITVCDRWRVQKGERLLMTAFRHFLSDIGPKPFPKAQIDRIDNEKGYYPENCRWVSVQENCRNRRSCLMIEYKGMRKSLTEFCEMYDLDRDTIKSRIRSGRTPEEAFATPTNHNFDQYKKRNGHKY